MTRHPLDLFSLLAGLLSVVAAAVWLLLERGHVDGDDLVWAAPVALVVVGLVAIVSSVRSSGTAQSDGREV